MMSDVPVKAVMIVFAVTKYAPAGTVTLVTRSSWPARLVLGTGLADVLVGDVRRRPGPTSCRRMFWTPLESLPDWIVPFLMSTFWIVPFLICLLVITVAATALPAQAATSATIEMTSAGLGRRSFMKFSPCV